MGSGKRDREKARYWQKAIREVVRSRTSIREFCRQCGLKESRFYWWQRKLKVGREERGLQQPNPAGNRGASPR
ncbi:MAG: IS66 family insertion sequence element accessory protein TnpA [Terriglobia bacterium]